MTNFYFGVVEDRISDPLKLGRCKVRIVGLHSEDKLTLPTADLPWAMIMQPTNSAAISGVGYSPTGIVEGSWVVVIFRDEYNQHPIIIGTLPGVPTKDHAKTEKSVPTVVSGDGSAVLDGSGMPIQSGETSAAQEKPAGIKVNFNKPFAMSISEEGLASIKSSEGLASLKKSSTGKPTIGKDSTPSDTTIYSYKDTRGLWTIGWGNRFLSNGTEVNENTTLSKREADSLFASSIRNDYEKTVKRNVKVPLTQSMFDVCVDLVYNMGGGNFLKSQFYRSLNQGKYEEAAALIEFTNTNNGTLKKRRLKEKALFLKDGIPQDDGSTKTIETETPTVPDATENPVVKKDSSFLPKTTEVDQPASVVFGDPNNIFPKYYNEPDTHRLARHDNIDGTIVYKKEAARVKNVKTSTGATWSQPNIPYNTVYPYNRVFSSESGHVQEFDDTPSNERIHTYHKSGTFTEIDVNGTQVNRIVGDSFEILERNGNVLIKGNCNITVYGDANFRIENNSTIETLGNMDLKVGGNLNIGSNGDIRLAASGEFSVDASAIHWNSEKSSGVPRVSDSANGTVSFPTLSVPGRYGELNSSYETPEEGSNEEWVNEQIKTGKIDPEETKPVETKTDEVTVSPKPAVVDPADGCDTIMLQNSFDGSYRITKNFTLGDLCKGQSGIPSGYNYGMSANQIVCNIKKLTVHCIEPIKLKYPNMKISSLWRSEAVNSSLKGASKKSDHLEGCAVDIQLTGFTRQQYYEAAQEIYKLLPNFRQVILEYKGDTTWIHVSYNTRKGNIKQALTIDAAMSPPKTLSSTGFVLP